MEAELQEYQQIATRVTQYLVEYSFQIPGALSPGAGLALQGLLSNYSSGVSIAYRCDPLQAIALKDSAS